MNNMISLFFLGPLLTMCAFNDMFTAVVLEGGAYYEDDEPQFNVFFEFPWPFLFAQA